MLILPQGTVVWSGTEARTDAICMQNKISKSKEKLVTFRALPVEANMGS